MISESALKGLEGVFYYPSIHHKTRAGEQKASTQVSLVEKGRRSLLTYSIAGQAGRFRGRLWVCHVLRGPGGH